MADAGQSTMPEGQDGTLWLHLSTDGSLVPAVDIPEYLYHEIDTNSLTLQAFVKQLTTEWDKTHQAGSSEESGGRQKHVLTELGSRMATVLDSIVGQWMDRGVGFHLVNYRSCDGDSDDVQRAQEKAKKRLASIQALQEEGAAGTYRREDVTDDSEIGPYIIAMLDEVLEVDPDRHGTESLSHLPVGTRFPYLQDAEERQTHDARSVQAYFDMMGSLGGDEMGRVFGSPQEPRQTIWWTVEPNAHGKPRLSFSFDPNEDPAEPVDPKLVPLLRTTEKFINETEQLPITTDFATDLKSLENFLDESACIVVRALHSFDAAERASTVKMDVRPFEKYWLRCGNDAGMSIPEQHSVQLADEDDDPVTSQTNKGKGVVGR